MDILSENNHSTDLRAEVLASPAYQERCALLFDLFRLSREAGSDPSRILSIQAELVELLLHFQTKQSEFKNENNEIGVAVVKRLILILKQIADSIVWRTLGYDRVVIQLLAEHPSTGHLDNTVFNDFAAAQQIVGQEGAIVLVNDLTTILRHGDLTIIGKDQVSLLETKHGRASGHNRRAIRQRRKLDELVSFLNAGVRIDRDRRDFILRVDTPLQTHQPIAAETIAQARQSGYCQTIVSDCLAIEAFWRKQQSAEFPPKRPFDGVEHIMWSHNLQGFGKPKTRVAPYGIFRFDDQSCFDLITGDILLAATLNLDSLQKRYKQFGLSLELPQFSQQEIDTCLSAPMAERKKLMDLYRLVVRDGKNCLSKTPDFLGRLGLELLHEDPFIQADRQLMNLVAGLNLPDDKTTRFYIGYKNEHEIWA